MGPCSSCMALFTAVGAGLAATGTSSFAAVADDLEDGQEDGGSDEKDQYYVEPHVRLPPTTGR